MLLFFGFEDELVLLWGPPGGRPSWLTKVERPDGGAGRVDGSRAPTLRQTAFLATSLPNKAETRFLALSPSRSQ